MRRLWSHIILAATSLMMVGATFATVVTNIDSNIEYSPGRELVFRVSRKGEDGNPTDEQLGKSDLKKVNDIANVMEERLKTANVSRYEIVVQGYDTIKVSLVQDSDSQYDIIKNYLPFNGSLAISNSKGTYALADEFLKVDEKAYLQADDNAYPQVIIPIDKEGNKFQAVYTEAKEMNDNGTGEVEVEDEEHEEGDEEHEHEHKAYLYLWYNFVEDYYSYDKIDQNSPDTYDPTIATKVLMTFDSANPFYTNEDGEEQDALRAYITANSEEGTEVTPEQLKSAYENARYFVNLLNAGKIDAEDEYTVNYMFYEKVSMLVESGDGLISLGKNVSVAWSRTFIATLCAIVVISLLLIYFYKLGALSIATTSIVSTFAGLIFIVIFGAEFTIAGLIGLISLALTSIISGIIYLNKFKEECYRGRSLKKANSEAAKKALLPTVDIHVVLVAMGIGAYALGGPLMKALALATILGGVASLIINLLGLRGLMWLVTNEQGLNNRYDLFDVSNDQVPNALEEEKQKYYGAYADKDFTKAKKPVGIASLVLLVASIATLITVGVINKGAVYNTNKEIGYSQVYVEYKSSTADNTHLSATTKENIDKMLANSYLSDGTKLSAIAEVESYDYVTNYKSTASGLTTVYYGYYRITFSKEIKLGDLDKTDDDAVITYKEEGMEGVEKPASEFFDVDFLTTDKVSDGAGLAFDHTNVTISLKNGNRVNADQPEFTSLLLATTVMVGISFLYLLLRYRLSRGLASLGIAVLVVGIAAGIFSMLYFVPATSYISVALLYIALFTFDISILFMNKERELFLEDRTKDNSVEARNALMKKSMGLAATPIIVSAIMAVWFGINFFGFMINSVSYVFLLALLGVIIATAIVLILFGPLAQLLFGWFSKVKIAKPKANKKAKARPVRVKKSAEPEEAIFIGIND